MLLPPGGRSKAGFTIVELAIVVAIVLAAIAILAPFVRMTKAWARRTGCAAHMRKLSLGLHRYARDRNDSFPATLGELYPRYVSDESAFDCPATACVGTPEDPDYLYVSGLTELSGEAVVIVRDKDGNHDGGGNALTIGGAIVESGA